MTRVTSHAFGKADGTNTGSAFRTILMLLLPYSDAREQSFFLEC